MQPKSRIQSTSRFRVWLVHDNAPKNEALPDPKGDNRCDKWNNCPTGDADHYYCYDSILLVLLLDATATTTTATADCTIKNRGSWFGTYCSWFRLVLQNLEATNGTKSCRCSNGCGIGVCAQRWWPMGLCWAATRQIPSGKKPWVPWELSLVGWAKICQNGIVSKMGT